MFGPVSLARERLYEAVVARDSEAEEITASIGLLCLKLNGTKVRTEREMGVLSWDFLMTRVAAVPWMQLMTTVLVLDGKISRWKLPIQKIDHNHPSVRAFWMELHGRYTFGPK